MYERINGTIRRLKNIDGTTTNVAYAQIPINVNFGANFRNTKMYNNEFQIEREINPFYDNGIKANVVCNIIKIPFPNGFSKCTTFSSFSPKNWHIKTDQIICYLPNLDTEETYNTIYNTFNNFKNKSLRKILNTILYNVTHGETPYANSLYKDERFVNIFATGNDSDTLISSLLASDEGFTTFSGTSFPQPYLLLNLGDNGKFNFIGYINTNPPNQHIVPESSDLTIPTYGIFSNGDANMLFVYYCTYKGV